MRATLVAVLALLTFAPSALAVDEVNTSKFRKDVTVGGIMAHERALQSIANANGGTRASGTPGFDASAKYVSGRLKKAGYKVKEQEFDFHFFQDLAEPALSQVSPAAKDYTTETYQYSGSGDVTAPVQPVDVVVPIGSNPPSTSTSGCEASDFDGFTAGNVALLQRGTCDFSVKAHNAEDAGASAVIIFNEGQAGRTDLLAGTLSEDIRGIPVLGLSYADGAELVESARKQETKVHAFASTLNEVRPTKNVIADTKQGDPDDTLVVGTRRAAGRTLLRCGSSPAARKGHRIAAPRATTRARPATASARRSSTCSGRSTARPSSTSSPDPGRSGSRRSRAARAAASSSSPASAAARVIQSNLLKLGLTGARRPETRRARVPPRGGRARQAVRPRALRSARTGSGDGSRPISRSCCRACSPTTECSPSRPTRAPSRSFRSTSSRRAATVPRGLRSSGHDHRDLPRLVRPGHQRPRRRDLARPRRSSTGSSSASSATRTTSRRMFPLDERVAFLEDALAASRQRHGRRLLASSSSSSRASTTRGRW